MLYDANAAHRLASATASAGGQSKPRAYAYDNAGNLLKETDDSKVLHEFNYDPAGHVYFRRSEPFATESWAYYYNNSDGTMVAKTGVGGGTTVYVGGVYEKNISGPTSEISYYYANGNRVAMRKDGALFFFAHDHLGGTSLVMNASGQMVNRIRYFPFGNVRTEEYFNGESAPPETDKLFTGQQRESPSGIYYYGARFYNAQLGRFIQPDPIIPTPGNPQALNRYSYVLNNPVRYNDPSGNIPMDDGTHAGPVWLYYPAPGSIPDWVDVPIDLLDPPESGGIGDLLDVAEWVPFYHIGDAVSGGRLAESCLDWPCDPWRAVGVVPVVPGKSGSFLRKILKFSDEAGDAARITHALRSGILSYKQAAKLTKGLWGRIQAHHILEQRHMRYWNYSAKEIVEAPAIVVTKEEHDRLTRLLRQELPYGHPYEKDRVWAAYQKVYGNYPEALQTIEKYFR